MGDGKRSAEVSRLNDWLLRHTRQAHSSGSAKTFVVAGDDRVTGYFSLTVGQVDPALAPEGVRKGMGQNPLPVVVLARLVAGVPRAWHRFRYAAGCNPPHAADGRTGGHPCPADPSH